MYIFCDFDGTISAKDTTDDILSRFALPEWEEIEAEWKAGKIGSAKCMQKQIALIKASRAELDGALDSLAIDPSFFDFNAFCESNNLPLTVISDGVDYFIKRILSRYALDYLPIIANTLAIEASSYSLTCSYSNPACSFGYGVCKCTQMAKVTGKKIFIGDGRSDFCAVHKADLIFAKGSLAVYCQQQNIPFTSYVDFSEIQRAIQKILPSEKTEAIFPHIISNNQGDRYGNYA